VTTDIVTYFVILTFMSSVKKQFPLHRPTTTYTQLAYIYVHTTADDFPQSLRSKLDDIFYPLIFEYVQLKCTYTSMVNLHMHSYSSKSCIDYSQI
jgi:hypothetical protein